MICALIASAVLSATKQGQSVGQDVLASFGLTPNQTILAVDGRASVGGDSVLLVGVADLARPELGVWSYGGAKVDAVTTDTFWAALDLDKDVRQTLATDPDKRTIALVFRLSSGLKRALDTHEDEGKSFKPQVSEFRRVGGYLMEARVLGPIAEGPNYQHRLEVAGGEWVTLIKFAITGETNEKGIEVVKRWQNDAQFVTINGKQEVSRRRIHYFTATLPAPLRDMELRVVSNDPAEDEPFLAGAVPQHIRGEDQAKEFEGKDLFVVPCVNKANFDREFTLQARPKRIVEFRDIPLKR